MEIIREHGFEVGGLCGGACACATCHVEVHAEWADKLYPANDDEEAMLDEVRCFHRLRGFLARLFTRKS
jgi:2Fe-2S ferredoxin